MMMMIRPGRFLRRREDAQFLGIFLSALCAFFCHVSPGWSAPSISPEHSSPHHAAEAFTLYACTFAVGERSAPSYRLSYAQGCDEVMTGWSLAASLEGARLGEQIYEQVSYEPAAAPLALPILVPLWLEALTYVAAAVTGFLVLKSEWGHFRIPHLGSVEEILRKNARQLSGGVREVAGTVGS